MIGFMLAVVIAALICLSFEATRLIAVAVLALLVLLLLYLYPLVFTALFVLGGVALCCTFYFNHKGVRQDGQLSLPDKSERSDHHDS